MALLNETLEGAFARIGGGFELLYETRPHGVSHFIGEQVHDAALLGGMLDLPLQAGMVISNEPGVYGRFWGTFDGVFYEDFFGVRVEDDLLLTKSGCENLSADIPKKAEEIEALVTSGNQKRNSEER